MIAKLRELALKKYYYLVVLVNVDESRKMFLSMFAVTPRAGVWIEMSTSFVMYFVM